MSLKEEIEQARKELVAAQIKHTALVKKCTDHKFVKTGYESAVCDVCGQHGGWWCPGSPNHVCDYERYDESMGGIYSDYDCCVYCEQPLERK